MTRLTIQHFHVENIVVENIVVGENVENVVVVVVVGLHIHTQIQLQHMQTLENSEKSSLEYSRVVVEWTEQIQAAEHIHAAGTGSSLADRSLHHPGSLAGSSFVDTLVDIPLHHLGH